MTVCLDGTGTSILFGTSGFNADIIGVDGPGATREAIDCTHLGTVDAMEFIPQTLADYGEIGLELVFDPDLEPPILDPAETVTITFPLPAGKSTPADWASSAFWTNYAPAVAIGERMTVSGTLKVSGKPAFTPSAV